ncbi:MAG: aldehyde dehydrogenase family protein, partial [Hyphomicrobiales bacterium]|nr:aldehyde dehydrogenase family protein [Hyphomicrobiales bacterium]
MKLADPTLLKSQCYIDGRWVGAAERDVTNPATGEVIAKVPVFGTAETREAIAAAERAFKPWAAKTAKERSAIMRRWFDLIIENADDIALLMTSEQGKPLA